MLGGMTGLFSGQSGVGLNPGRQKAGMITSQLLGGILGAGIGGSTEPTSGPPPGLIGTSYFTQPANGVGFPPQDPQQIWNVSVGISNVVIRVGGTYKSRAGQTATTFFAKKHLVSGVARRATSTGTPTIGDTICIDSDLVNLSDLKSSLALDLSVAKGVGHGPHEVRLRLHALAVFRIAPGGTPAFVGNVVGGPLIVRIEYEKTGAEYVLLGITGVDL